MGWPVEWLKRMISASEFDRWILYFRRQPFDDQSNHHIPLASLQSTVANLAGGNAKLTDFLIFRQQKAAPKSEANLDAKFMAWAMSFKPAPDA